MLNKKQVQILANRLATTSWEEREAAMVVDDNEELRELHIANFMYTYVYKEL